MQDALVMASWTRLVGSGGAKRGRWCIRCDHTPVLQCGIVWPSFSPSNLECCLTRKAVFLDPALYRSVLYVWRMDEMYAILPLHQMYVKVRDFWLWVFFAIFMEISCIWACTVQRTWIPPSLPSCFFHRVGPRPCLPGWLFKGLEKLFLKGFCLPSCYSKGAIIYVINDVFC